MDYMELPISKEDAILNLGCGDGIQAAVYKGEFKKMTGIDINEDRLRVARQLAAYCGINNFEVIRAIDGFFCELPVLKNFGQALVCIYENSDYKFR